MEKQLTRMQVHHSQVETASLKNSWLVAASSIVSCKIKSSAFVFSLLFSLAHLIVPSVLRPPGLGPAAA